MECGARCVMIFSATLRPLLLADNLVIQDTIDMEMFEP